VSTAYQFYEAVKKFLKFIAKTYSNDKAKPPFEATGYELFYVASDEQDEQGKTDVAMTLDMSTKWDCTPLPGCSTCYEFIGMQATVDNRNQIGMRTLPCPCEFCLCLSFELCVNKHIVEDMGFFEMSEVEFINSPNELEQPLASKYTVADLKAFILHHDLKLPKDCRKPALIEFINGQLAQFIIIAS
jgi:hypothetical protein